MLVCSALTLFSLLFGMNSVSYDSSNGSLSLQPGTERPVLRDGDVLIKVKAAGVNRLDLIQVSGKYPPPEGESPILGVEVSGEIAELSKTAAELSNFKLGDKVMALIGGGGYAEYCRAPYQVVMPVPDGVSLTHAAGIPEAYLTAYQALVLNGHLQDGETILVHAGASGVGLAAAQIAKALWKNVVVIITAGSQEKLDFCLKNGADFAINYKTENFSEKVMHFTQNKGADVILDFVGAPYWANHSSCVAVDGRIVHLGFLGGAVLESADLRLELKKRVTHLFSTLRSRTLQYRAELVKQFTGQAQSLFSSGSLKVCVDSVFQASDATNAHKRMRENKNIGKIIIEIS